MRRRPNIARRWLVASIALISLAGCSATAPSSPTESAWTASASQVSYSLSDADIEYKATLAAEGIQALPLRGTAGTKQWVDITTKWTKTAIPVCWESMPSDLIERTKRQWVEDALSESWEFYSLIDFTGFKECAPLDGGIHVQVADDVPRTIGLGNQLNAVTNGLRLNFTFANWRSDECKTMIENCIKATAVHEFGHALAFVHEQNRHDTPSTCKEAPQGSNGNDTLNTPWDPDSVMNYCAKDRMRKAGKLSLGDQGAIGVLYGATR